MIIDAGAYPSPLGYGGFPKSVCTSVNECMCHGIPDSRQLQVQVPCIVWLVASTCLKSFWHLKLFMLYAGWWHNKHRCDSLLKCKILITTIDVQFSICINLFISWYTICSGLGSLCHTSYLHLFFQGYHGDTSKTFVCGNVSPAMKRLIKVPFSSCLLYLVHAVYIFVLTLQYLLVFLLLIVCCYVL